MKTASGFLLGFFALILAARADPLPKSFLHTDRIYYDGRCLTIDGRDTFIFSGAFHYFRCPKALWRARFRKIKDAGCNAVETYVPWNWHERGEPSSPADFSQVDLSDLKEWLRMAQDEFGLYTIVRPGPYICAEWDGGGFPRWLLAKMSRDKTVALRQDAARLRSDDPVFLAWAKHWMEAVCPVIAGEQITRKPRGHCGVILLQIENEYDLYPGVPAPARVAQLRTLYQAAVANGIEVPIFTCLTRQGRDSGDPLLSQVFDAVNAYPRLDIDATARDLENLQSAQPDAPAMVSELQGGWFSKVGGPLSEDQPGLSAEQLNAHTLLAIASGATILNYYMLFGGTNFGLWGARNMTTTYDYDAPIREPGGVGAKYLVVAAIGRMLREHGPALARSWSVPCQIETSNAEITVAARRTRETGFYLFFRNHSVAARQRGSAVVWLENRGGLRVRYDLGPMGSRILYLTPNVRWPFESEHTVLPPSADGRPLQVGVEWLPKPMPGPVRPVHLPAAIRLARAEMRTEPGGADWVDVPPGALLPELGVFDARPVVYQATVSLTPEQRADIDTLRIQAYAGDGLVVRVNGHEAASGTVSEAAISRWLRVGENTLTVLYDQAGQPNYGRIIQDEPGLRSADLGNYRLPEFTPVLPVTGWRLARSLSGIAAGWPSLGLGAQPLWTALALDARTPIPRTATLADAPSGSADALAAWYGVEFELPSPEKGIWVPWRAAIDAAGDGLIYLNGHALGRYWEAGPQREYYLPECWLNFGPAKKNLLTLCLYPMQKGVRLRAVEVAPYAEQAERR